MKPFPFSLALSAAGLLALAACGDDTGPGAGGSGDGGGVTGGSGDGGTPQGGSSDGGGGGTSDGGGGSTSDGGSGGDGGGGGGSACGGPVAQADFCAAFGQAYCEALALCFPLSEDDITECALRSACDQEQFDASIAAGAVVYDGEEASCCFAAFPTDECPLYNGFDFAMVPSCQAAGVGQGQSGDDCNFNGECASDYCDLTAGTCPGTCAAKVGVGDPCNDSPALCDIGLSCDVNTLLCAARPALGDPCVPSSGVPCSEGACADPDANDDGTCSAPPTNGEACSFGTLVCDGASSCQITSVQGTGTCMPFRNLNESCQANWRCAAGLACVGANPLQGVEGVCQPRLEEGDACNPNDNVAVSPCGLGILYECQDDGTCAPDPLLGETCSAAADNCVASFCGGGTCQALLDDGEVCSADNQCLSNACNGTCRESNICLY